MLTNLVLLPIACGVLVLAVGSTRLRRLVLVGCALLHAALTAAAWWRRPGPAWGGMLALDAAGLTVLGVLSLLFLAVAFYAVGYLGREATGSRPDFEEGPLFANAPEAVFTSCLLLFLGTMTLVAVAHHVALVWIAVEATTLASAPLIYFHRQHRSLEATWKYRMLCSVGIGLALLGVLFLALSAAGRSGGGLLLDELVREGRGLDPAWLRLAAVFMIVGYGTKMGLAPLHTWLPDAHSEAPSLVSALLSGALLNCAFLAIFRMQQVSVAAGLGTFTGGILVALGLVSLVVAGFFLVGRRDYKRMLAYSSVEHMGILSLATGLGGPAVFAAFLHLVGHSLAKAALFLTAGNILAGYRTKAAAQMRGVVRSLPRSGAIWVAGLLAITGTPPSALFLSELAVARAAAEQRRYGTLAAFLVLLTVAFAGMATTMLRMAHGEAAAPAAGPEPWSSTLPPAVLLLACLALGLSIPAALDTLLHEAAALVGAGP